MKFFNCTMGCVDDLNELCNKGWECRRISDGVLLDGSYVLIAPDKNHYSYVILETYANEWSSYYRVMKCAKVPAKYIQMCEQYEAEEDKEEA